MTPPGYAPYDPDADPYIAAIRAEAESDPDVIGLILCGSRATGLAHAESDYDLCFVLTDAAHQRYTASDAWPARGVEAKSASAVKVDIWEECPRSLARDRVPSWAIPSYAEARVLLDKTGAVTGALEALTGLSADEANAIARAAYDDYLNSLYRSLKAWRRGDDLGGRVHAAHSTAPLLRMLFALERRHAPYYDRLRLHLDALAGQGWAPDELRVALLELISTGDPRRQQDFARRVAALMAARGVGGVYDDWDGQIDEVLGWRFG